MKPLILLIIISFCINITLLAGNGDSKSNFNLKSGLGYFTHVKEITRGETMWIEAGKLMPNGFLVTGRVACAITHITMGSHWGPFEGQRKLDIYYMGGVIFSRPYRITGNHSVEPGIGFLYSNLYYTAPSVYVEERDEELWLLVDAGTYYDHEIYLTFTLDYLYKISNYIKLGGRVDLSTSMFTGIEGLTISSIISIQL